MLADCKAAGWKVTVLGSGTRVLFREGGLDGVVLKLGADFVGCRSDTENEDPELLYVGAGTPVPAVLAHAAARGLSIPEGVCAVPGTFGASALVEDWPVESVRFAKPSGVKTHPADRLTSRTKGVILGATLRLSQVGESEAWLALRKATRTAHTPAGSWVMGVPRVRTVMRQAALDRVRLRNVAIPLEAPELLVNLGDGTAQDMQLLHKSALERVKKTRGVTLRSRMRWIGKKREGMEGR